MAGIKRSTRLAARQVKPKYNDLRLEQQSEEEEYSPHSKESDENEESDFSERVESDGATKLTSPLPPADARAVTRKGRLDRQPKMQVATSTKLSTTKTFKGKAKKKSKTKGDIKEKPEMLSLINDDGSDHAEENTDVFFASREETTQKSIKRSRSTSDDSMGCKKSKREKPIIKKSSQDCITTPGNSMKQATSLNDVGDLFGADSANRDENLQLASNDAGADEGDSRGEAGNDSIDRATQTNVEPEKATNNTHGTHSNSCLKAKSTPLTRMPGELPADTKSSDSSEEETRPKAVTTSSAAKFVEDIPNNLLSSIGKDSERMKSVDCDGKKSVDARGGSSQTSINSSMQKDDHGKEHYNNKSSSTALLLTNALTAPSELIYNKKETLSSKEKAAPIEPKRVVAEIFYNESKKTVTELDQSKSDQFTLSHTEMKQTDIQRKDISGAISECVCSGIPLGEPGSSDMMSRIILNETACLSSQALKEMERSSSSPPENQRGESSESSRNEVARTKTVSSPKQHLKLKRKRRLPSVGQLKMVLFLEASNSHRDNGGEHMFANYWEALEKYVTVGPHAAIKSTRSDLSPIFAGNKVMLRGFLKTRKLKRLHNKLVLAIMQEAMRTTIPEYCSSYIPQQWQSATFEPTCNQFQEEDISVYDVYRDQSTDLIQWKSTFGPCSGTWTVCGDGLARPKMDAGQALSTQLVDIIQKRNLEEVEILPSSRLPGALEIEPLVRKYTEKSGLMASGDAIWMLVVAVRAYSSSLIEKALANDKDFHDGYLSSLPIFSQTSLACNHLMPKDCNASNKEKTLTNFQFLKSSGSLVKCEKRVINSTSLSHVLAETSSVASRLAFIRSIVIPDGKGAPSYCPDLDDVNCIINASIQRGASSRQRSFTSNQNVLTKATMSLVSDFGRNSLSTEDRPSQSTITALLPLDKPQLKAQTRNYSITTLPPQYQSSLPSTRPQKTTQPTNLAQVMVNHSYRANDIKRFGQQTSPISRTDMLNLEPLTKSGFPSFTNDPQKQKPSQNPASSTETSPPRVGKRGAKDLATMMARPLSQSNIVSNKGSASDGKNVNGDPPDKVVIQKRKDQTDMLKESAKDKKDDTEKSTLPVARPSRPKGRGFGVKNLSKMRARVSDSGN